MCSNHSRVVGKSDHGATCLWGLFDHCASDRFYDDENDNGQNPIPELTNLNINNFTLSQLHELRNAINIRIDELAPPPPVAMDLADVLQLQNVVVAVRKTQQVEAVYAVALHNFG